MSPWEQEALLAPLLAELPAGTAAEALRRESDALRRDWRSLWARWGEAPEGWPAYRARLDAFAARLPAYADLRLPNGLAAVEAVRHAVVLPALHPDLAAGRSRALSPAASPAPTGGAGQAPASPAGRAGEASAWTSPFERPLFIVAPPRSGTSLLFETLAQSPDAWTAGGESHALFEGIAALHPAARGWESTA